VQAGTLLALLLAMIVVNVGLLAFAVLPRRRRAGGDAEPELPPVERIDRVSPRHHPAIGPVRDPDDPAVDGVPTATYDRVVRIVSLVFILMSSTVVVVTGLWPETEAAVLVLLALAGLIVFAIHDILPTRLLGPARFIAEGSLAITFVALLVALTGREDSPFFFGFALVVVGAALVVEPRVTVALSVAAIAGYLVAVGIRPPDDPLDQSAIAAIGINVSALIFLSYVAMVIAREQRRSRDAAIRLSSIDSLTGLFNRSYFFAALEREIQRTARSDRGFCLLMLDLDGLKDQRPIRPLPRRPGAPPRRRDDPGGRAAHRHGRPLWRRRVRGSASRDGPEWRVRRGREDPADRLGPGDRRAGLRVAGVALDRSRRLSG